MTYFTEDALHAVMVNAWMEDALEHMEMVARDEREDAPDPEYAEMSIDERNAALDEHAREEAAWAAETYPYTG